MSTFFSFTKPRSTDFLKKCLLSGTTLTKVRGEQKPKQQPLSAIKVQILNQILLDDDISSFYLYCSLQGFQELLSPTEVFACENSTLFFYHDENFFLAFGETFCFLYEYVYLLSG